RPRMNRPGATDRGSTATVGCSRPIKAITQVLAQRQKKDPKHATALRITRTPDKAVAFCTNPATNHRIAWRLCDSLSPRGHRPRIDRCVVVEQRIWSARHLPRGRAASRATSAAAKTQLAALRCCPFREALPSRRLADFRSFVRSNYCEGPDSSGYRPNLD